MAKNDRNASIGKIRLASLRISVNILFMRLGKIFCLFFVVSSMTIVGCGSSMNEAELMQASQEFDLQLSKINLIEANSKDIISFSRDFSGKQKVVICHFADDSPELGSIILLDLTEVLAIEDREAFFSESDFLGPCSNEDSLDDIIVIADPVFEIDGKICEGLEGEEKRECVLAHHQEYLSRF